MRLALQLLCVVVAVVTLGCQCGPAVNPADGGSGGGGGASGGGAGGGAAGGGLGGGATECALNSVLCNAQCTLVLDDPLNCGGCGVTCAAPNVCTGAQCVAASQCPEARTACDGRCVDLKTDDRHCGGCSAGSACGAGQGCVDGNCVNALVFDAGSGNCQLGGGPITVTTADAGSACTGNLAQVTFRWAVCACSTFVASGPFASFGFDSMPGAYDGGLGAGVGANQSLRASASFDIGGACWAGAGGATITAPGDVRQELHVGAAASGAGSRVHSNAFVDGDVSNFSIAGQLHVPASGNVGAGVTATGGTVLGPVTVAPPCDCLPGQLIDVAGIVATGQAQNDDVAVGLDPGVLDSQGGGEVRLDLPCGRYYLSRVKRSTATVIAVHGRTALFIGGDLQVSAPFAVAIDPNAELDIFVGGNFTVTAQASFGSTEVPAQTRIYIAGANASISANAVIAGNFYMPHAELKPSADVSLYGSAFCGSFDESAGFRVHYDRAITRAGHSCGLDAGTPGVDGGPSGCGSCRDCNNQACIGGQCGSCTADSECCAPLGCINGVCQSPVN